MIDVTPKVMSGSFWPKKEMIAFWERSGSYSGYKKTPVYLEDIFATYECLLFLQLQFNASNTLGTFIIKPYVVNLILQFHGHD